MCFSNVKFTVKLCTTFHRDMLCVDFGFEAIWKVTSSYMPNVLDGPATHVRRQQYLQGQQYLFCLYFLVLNLSLIPFSPVNIIKAS